MCDELIEFPLEYEETLSKILSISLEAYIDHNYTTKHVISIITSYIFCNEYYLRRDGHFIEANTHMITIYLYKSKLCRNLYKLKCPIRGQAFTKYINSISEHNKLSAWIDTECKEESFNESKAANMMNKSCFLLMTYFQESRLVPRQQNTPWLAQWRYNGINSMPYIQIIARIVSYPTNWNYVSISYEPCISCIFYTCTEQHTIRYIADEDNSENDYNESVSVVKYAENINYPWLMFGSAATKILKYNDVKSLFGDKENKLLQVETMNDECEYFVTRCCKDFVEMKDAGTFWTNPRDHVAIIQIRDKQKSYKRINEEEKDNDNVRVDVLCQFQVFEHENKENELLNDHLLDVTITNQWSTHFQKKYGIKADHTLFLVLYSSINHKDRHSELYAMYIDVREAKMRIVRKCKLASSQCLTKFLVGRGCYQTVFNDWLCTLIGVDENNLEIRHQLRLNEELELLYYKKGQRDENVQELTSREKCYALKYFEEAKEDEIEMQKVQRMQQQQPGTAQIIWQHLVSSRHLILSTLIGAYIGWRVSKAMRSGQWTFGRFRFGFS